MIVRIIGRAHKLSEQRKNLTGNPRLYRAASPII